MFDRHDEDNLIFLAEVEELLVVMENGLLHLERDGLQEHALNDVFRAAHTIKGGAGLLGIGPLAEATHLLEDLLDGVRNHQVALRQPVLDVLLQSLDWLRSAKAQLQTGSLPATNHALLQRLQDLLPEAAAAQDVQEAEVLPERAAAGCVIVVRFPQETELLSVRQFQTLALAREHWQVLGSAPSEQELLDDRVGPVLRMQLAQLPQNKELAAVLSQIPEVSSYDVEVSREAARTTQWGDSTRQAHTVRISVDLLDELLALAGELVVDRARLADVLANLAGQSHEAVGNRVREIANHMGRITTQLQEGIMRGRLVPLSTIFRKFPRLIRDLSKAAGKQVDLNITGEGTELDRSVMEYIDDPLVHILRNSIDHGIEPPEERVAAGKSPVGSIQLAAEHAQSQITITVHDDGRGIDPQQLKQRAVAKGVISDTEAARLTPREALDLIFSPGFTTADRVTEVSGRGVGLDVVQTNLRRISGRVEVTSTPGEGSTFSLYLPLTLAIIRGLLVSSGDATYIFPVTSVVEAVPTNPDDVHHVVEGQLLSVRDQLYPLMRLDVLLGEASATQEELNRYALLVQAQTGTIALGVDSIVGEQEIVIKELGAYLGQVPGVTGATILGDGGLALIIDPTTLLETRRGRYAGESLPS